MFVLDFCVEFLEFTKQLSNVVLLDPSEFPAWPSSELVSVELPLAVAAAAVVVVVAAVVLAVVFAVVVVAMAICNAIASVVALRTIPEEKASFFCQSHGTPQALYSPWPALSPSVRPSPSAATTTTATTQNDKTCIYNSIIINNNNNRSS